MIILPAALAHTKTELKKQLDSVKWAKNIHLDIMDGRFVPKKTFPLTQIVPFLKQKNVQVHLMVKNPKIYLRKLRFAKEIIYHVETKQDLIDEIHGMRKKAGICFNPNTKIEKYKDMIKRADIAQIMLGKPGKQGQKLMPSQLKKIKQIKKINPRIIVGVDIGVKESTIRTIKKAGADYAAAGSAIQKAQNPKKEYLILRKI